jgi:hypothetical protein
MNIGAVRAASLPHSSETKGAPSGALRLGFGPSYGVGSANEPL